MVNILLQIHLCGGSYFIFANFPSFVLSAKMSYYAEERWNPNLGSRLDLYWPKTARFLNDVCPFSSQGPWSPLGLCSEATWNSFHFPGNQAPASSYSFSAMWVLISLNITNSNINGLPWGRVWSCIFSGRKKISPIQRVTMSHCLDLVNSGCWVRAPGLSPSSATDPGAFACNRWLDSKLPSHSVVLWLSESNQLCSVIAT